MKIQIEIPDKYSSLLKAYMATFNLQSIEAVAEYMTTDLLDAMDKNMADELKDKIEKSVSQ